MRMSMKQPHHELALHSQAHACNNINDGKPRSESGGERVKMSGEKRPTMIETITAAAQEDRPCR